MEDPYAIYTYKQDRGHDGAYKVGRREPRLQGIAEHFAKCFCREMHYDLFAVSNDEDHSTYLIGYGGKWIGACGFSRVTRNMDSSQPGPEASADWVFDWFWLHPFARRYGLLKNAWKQFTATYGDFLLRGPLSPEMRHAAEAFGVAKDRVWCSPATAYFADDE